MDKQTWGPGIRPTANGKAIRIRIWQGNYSETFPGNPYEASGIKAAQSRRQELLSRVKLGLPLYDGQKAKKSLFLQDAQDYMDTLDIKHSTTVGYLSIINRYLIPKYGHWITAEIKDFKKWVLSLPVGQKTKWNIISVAKGIFIQAEVPFPPIRLKKAQKTPVERYLPKERDRLLDNLKGPECAFFALFIGCGLRPGEILALEWTDYDGTELSVTKQIVRRRDIESTKTYQRRKVYVPVWVRRCLELSSRFEGGRIFDWMDTDEVYGAWKTAHRKARIPYRRPYTCRHTRAAELLSTGVQPADAAKQLGHSLLVFLKTYAEWIEEYSDNQDLSRFEGVTKSRQTIG